MNEVDAWRDAGGKAGDRQVLLVVASVAEQKVAAELEKRRRGRGGNESGEGGVVERERGEASECTEEARKANREQEHEVEGRWRTGCGTVWFGFRLQGFRIFKAHKNSEAKGRGEGRVRVSKVAAIVTVTPHMSLSDVKCSLPRAKSKILGHPCCTYILHRQNYPRTFGDTSEGVKTGSLHVVREEVHDRECETLM
jgi:hypothetical protein